MHVIQDTVIVVQAIGMFISLVASDSSRKTDKRISAYSTLMFCRTRCSLEPPVWTSSDPQTQLPGCNCSTVDVAVPPAGQGMSDDMKGSPFHDQQSAGTAAVGDTGDRRNPCMAAV